MPGNIGRAIGWICVGVLAVFSSDLAAAEPQEDACEIPAELARARPDAEGPPTAIKLSTIIADIPAIFDAEQLFEADFRLELSWRDERLSAEQLGHSLEGCHPKLEQVWHPFIALVNRRDVTQLLAETVEVDAAGEVFYAQRFAGLFAARFDLREFPLDEQVLTVDLASPLDSRSIAIFPDVARSGRMAEPSIPDWTLGQGNVSIASMEVGGRTVTRASFSVPADRRSSYYFFRVLVPLVLITLMSFSVFLIDPQDLSSQVQVSASSVLTLIMFNFSLQELLPRVAYLTRMDLFVLGATFLVFGALAESIATAALTRRGKHELAVRIDGHARWLFPSLLALLMLAARFR